MTDESVDGIAVHIEQTATATVLTISGELDMVTVPDLTAHLDEYDEKSGLVVLDMTGVTFFDSTGLSCLIAATLRGVDLRVVASPQVAMVVELTETNTILKLVASLAEAGIRHTKRA